VWCTLRIMPQVSVYVMHIAYYAAGISLCDAHCVLCREMWDCSAPCSHVTMWSILWSCSSVLLFPARP
jgi:hypothetical protein